MGRPLILVTNDDGITSAGLWAVVEAVLPLGEVLVVAPDRQWSGAGRAMPREVTGRLVEQSHDVAGELVRAYAVDASPAQAVGHAVLELTSRPPDLVISGINFGPNLGIEVTISGTVGAALEAAAFDIPALAVSLEMDPAYYLEGDAAADYAASQSYVRRFAQLLLRHRPPRGIDVLNVNVPADATPETFWRLTRLSRHRYFVPLPPNRAQGQGRAGYKLLENPAATELDSDILTLAVARMVSVTPLSLDMTAQVDFPSLNTLLLSDMAAGTDLTRISTLLKQYPMLG